MENTIKTLLLVRKETKETIRHLNDSIKEMDACLDNIISHHDCRGGAEHGCEVCEIINQPD
jgi:hypothetical protein